MHHIPTVFMLAGMLVFMAVFASMAVAGVWRGRIYYEPNCPPVIFRNRPVAFVSLCLFYLAIVGLCAVGAFRIGSVLLDTL